MLDQLKELLEMQRVLDESIFKEHGITEYPLENMKLALFDELGELLHEYPTKYKHWKKTAVDNREKGLEEYVDVIHFALSLHNYFKSTDEKPYECGYDWCPCRGETLFEKLWNIVEDLYDTPKHLLEDVFSLGKYLGFTWKEIYEAYKKKNAVNYQRIKNGY
jgi:dimeric dUTPase (all-alpha-NTP-PPase superfamily)